MWCVNYEIISIWDHELKVKNGRIDGWEIQLSFTCSKRNMYLKLIFWHKMMVKSGLEKIVLKFLHASKLFSFCFPYFIKLPKITNSVRNKRIHYIWTCMTNQRELKPLWINEFWVINFTHIPFWAGKRRLNFSHTVYLRVSEEWKDRWMRGHPSIWRTTLNPSKRGSKQGILSQQIP